MAAADGISSPPASPAKELPTVSDILAAANMRRLLQAYQNLAPLTIGGPSSTSLETPGTPLSSRPPHTFPDPRLLRKFAHYPWLLGAQGIPPGLSMMMCLGPAYHDNLRELLNYRHPGLGRGEPRV